MYSENQKNITNHLEVIYDKTFSFFYADTHTHAHTYRYHSCRKPLSFVLKVVNYELRLS